MNDTSTTTALQPVASDGLFASFEDHPFILWEPREQTTRLVDVTTGEVTHPFINGLVRAGLPLARGWHPGTLPEVSDWHVHLHRGRISVGPVGGPVVYSHDADVQAMEWVTAAGDRCALLAGTGLGLVDPGLTQDALAEAARDGRLVGARVSLVRGRLDGPAED